MAVKIQYPAIRSAIEDDFKLLRFAAIPARLILRSREPVIAELEQGILKETDYLNEGLQEKKRHEEDRLEER